MFRGLFKKKNGKDIDLEKMRVRKESGKRGGNKKKKCKSC